MPDDVNNNGPPKYHIFSTVFRPGDTPFSSIVHGDEDHTIVVESFSPEPEDEYITLMQFESPFDKQAYQRVRNGAAGSKSRWQPPEPSEEEQAREEGDESTDLRRRMAWVERHVEAGREAFKNQRWHEVEGHYRAALELLEERIDRKRYGSTRLYHAFIDGREILDNAVFMVAAFNTYPNDFKAIESRLEVIIENSTDEHGKVFDSYAYARAMLQRAFTLMRYASAGDIQDVKDYEIAEEMVRSALGHLNEGSDDYFAAQLLLIDLIERQVERAHHRGDRDERMEHETRLLVELKFFIYEHEDHSPAKRVLVALIGAHAARLFGRMGLWEQVLDLATTITESRAYRHTPQARELLSDPLFEPLVEDGAFITPEEFKNRRPKLEAKLKRLWATVDNAHTRGILQSLGAAAVGILLGLGANYVFTGDVYSSTLVPALFAMGGSMVNKLMNGWITEEARNADLFNRYEGTAKETAKRAGEILLRGGLTFLASWGLTEIAFIAPAFYGELRDTLGRAGELYWSFANWIGNTAASVLEPETYVKIYDAYRSYVDELSQLHPGLWIPKMAAEVAYVTYLGYAAKHYYTWLRKPELRKELKEKANFYLLPALFLGAEVGAIINDKELVIDRLVRGSIATTEGLGMLFCGGVVALSKHRGVRQSVRAMWDAVVKSDRNILISLAITANIGSALGGLMGKGPENLPHLGLYVARGMGISIGLLPLVLGVSGFMKGTITWTESGNAAWQDAKDFNPPTRAAIALAGRLEAVATPYTYNKLFRGIFNDLLMAPLRTWVPGGWDGDLGQAVFSAGNFAAFNHYNTTIWAESVDTSWERDSTVENLGEEEPDTEKIRDQWIKAGLHISPFHPLQPHSLKDAAYPLWSITRSVSPPPFPQKTETNFFASQYQLIKGGYYQKFEKRHMDALLQQVFALIMEGTRPKEKTDDRKVEARRKAYKSLAKSWVKVLWELRNDSKHGEAIQNFFRRWPWIPYALSVDLGDEPEIKGRFRAINKWRMKWRLRTRRRQHRQAIKEYAARIKPSLMDGLNVRKGKVGIRYNGPAFTGERRADEKDDNGGGNTPPSPGAGTAGTGAPPTSDPEPSPPTGSSAAASVVPSDSIPDSVPRLSLGSFWKEEEPPPKQEVIIRPMSPRELRRRRARSQGKRGQIITSGARPAPPQSTQVLQIIRTIETASKPILR